MESSFGETIRRLREEQNLLLRELSAKLEIDPSVLSKIETDNRVATKNQVQKLAEVFKIDYQKLLIIWFSDKIADELKNEENISEILKMTEQKIKNEK
ncbi:MAG: helix-turn-helix transcriptional regulator [Maribacter sp.]